MYKIQSENKRLSHMSPVIDNSPESKATFSTIMSIQSPKILNTPVSNSKYHKKQLTQIEIEKKSYSPSTETIKSAREIRTSISNSGNNDKNKSRNRKSPSPDKANPFQNLSQISGLSHTKYSGMLSGNIDPATLDVIFLVI